MVNGAAHAASGDLTIGDLVKQNYVIAYIDLAQGYVGRAPHGDEGGRLLLEDAWLMLGQYGIQMDQEGNLAGIQRPFAFLPIEMSDGINTIRVFPSSVIWFSDLRDDDLRTLGNAVLRGIAMAKEVRRKMRAQRSGITIAPPNLKLPPMPRKQ